MRNKLPGGNIMVKKNWNREWKFTKEKIDPGKRKAIESAGYEEVDLPHTWNGEDGQDGGADYYRGTCWYEKMLRREETDGRLYIEFEGTNSSAVLYVNGVKAASHDGGYSTWRADLTDLLQDENEIVVAVDNAPNDHVYPQSADFTFYGGIYRNVSLISAGETHFDLDYHGGPGIKVTPEVCGSSAKVSVQSFVTKPEGAEVGYTILDKEGNIIASARADADAADKDFIIEDVHLWNGIRDPYLYTLKALLYKGEEAVDERTVRFGCRSFRIDPEEGFILNGRPYPLRGVSRHQDRPHIGNALLPEHHREDIDLILEMGANTIRLAHYQHNQYFYDLCNEKGLVIWAEIPYISKHMPNGRGNTISQMTELIIQNYNHPCIAVWGLSNEITMGGADDPDLISNHRELNELAHRLDPTRLTTIAVVSMCGIDAEYLKIPDVLSYNHYFGWYGGDVSSYAPFFDNFHAKYPDRPVGLSEYGAEALNWHTSRPESGDYTEEYQAKYHEEVIRQLFKKKYIWATHVWNMFDFAADARAEGGENGMNHKGLVTFDRKYRKDAFYAYKAWLSDDPFVHICSKRYIDRVEDVTKVTGYSNQPEVELFLNGKSFEKKTAEDHFFYFEVPNAGTTEITAKAGDCEDSAQIRKVDKMNEDYVLHEAGVINWFEIDTPEGYYSINDRLDVLFRNEQTRDLFMGILSKALSSGGTGTAGGGVSADMMKMMGSFTAKRLLLMMNVLSGPKGKGAITKEMILGINSQLNKIPRSE